MLKARGLRQKAVTITRSDKVTRDGPTHRIPKRDLVTTTNLLLESRWLKIPTALPLARTHAEELHNLKRTISPLANDSYGADDERREAAHDDLVLSVALAARFREHDKGGYVAFPQAISYSFGFRQLTLPGG